MGRRRCCCAEDCVIFYDTFDRATIGPNWRVCSGQWSIVDGRLREEGTPGALILLEVQHPIADSASSVARVKTFNGKVGARHRIYLNKAENCDAGHSYEYALLLGGPEHSIRNAAGTAIDLQDEDSTPPFSCIPERDPGLDDFLTEAGTFTSPASEGQQLIELTDATWGINPPKVVIISHAGQTGDGISWGGKMGFGIAVSATMRAAIAAFCEDNLDVSNTGRRHDNTKCIILLDETGVVEAADFVEFRPTDIMSDLGFVLNWTTASATEYKYNFVAMGGDFLTDVHLKEIQSPASSGVVPYTGVGFKADGAIGFTAGLATAPAATADDALFGVGMADKNDYTCHHIFSEDNVDTANTARRQVQKFLSIFNGSGVLDECVGPVYSDDGYSLNWSTADATQRYCWILAFKGPDCLIVRDTLKTAIGNKTTTLGFDGMAGLFGCAMATASANTEDGARLAIGMLDNTDRQASSGMLDEDNVDTSHSARYQHASRMLEVYDHSDVLQGAATGEFTGGNLVVNRVVATDSVEYEWAGLVLGQAIGAGALELVACNSKSGFAGYPIGCITTKVWDEDYDSTAGNRWMALGNASSSPIEFDWVSYEMHWEDDPLCLKCHCACHNGDDDRKMPPKTLIATIEAYDGCAGTCMDGLEIELVYSLVDDSWIGTETCECEEGHPDPFVANIELFCGDYPLQVTDWVLDQLGTCNVLETTPSAEEGSTCDPMYLTFGPFEVPNGDLACPCCGFVSEAGYYNIVVEEP